MARQALVLGLALALTAGCGSSSKRTESTPSTVTRQQGPPVRAHGQFLVMAGGGSGVMKGRLYLVDAASGRTRLIGDDLDLFEIPRWSPDGSRVLAAAIRHENDDLISYPASGARPANLTSTRSEWESGGRWSPDGTRIAYLLQHDGQELYVARADGGSPRLVTRHVDGFAWSPDGRRLVLAPGSDRREHRLLVVPAAGGRTRPLGPSGTGEFIDWGPRGQLLYEADGLGPTPTYLWTGERDTSLGEVEDAQFLPDGTVAFGDGLTVGFVRPNVADRTAKLVDRPTSYSWSADGRYLAFVSAWNGHVYVARADGSGIHRLPARLGTSQIEVFGWRPNA